MVHLEPIKKILMQANTTYGKAGVAASDKKKYYQIIKKINGEWRLLG